MMHDPMDMPCGDEGEKPPTPQSEPSERLSPESLMSDAPTLSEMSLAALTEYCIRETSHYRNGEPFDEQYGLELFRRALLQHDQDARGHLQQCFSETVLNWLRRHPYRETAQCFDSEENYVTQTFERFWQATAHNQQLAFNSLCAAFKYLQASLNGAILDTLRAYQRPKEVPLPEPGTPEEPLGEDTLDSNELWELLREKFPDKKDQRLIYLFFYCGLKPREIVRHCPEKFSDLREVYRLRCKIHERLQRDMDHLRWRLGK
jgi:hypothetical protein